VPVFGSTFNVTVPFPLPELPNVIWTQAAALVAVQAQPMPAVIPTLPVPPVLAKSKAVAERVYVQPPVPAV